MSAYSWGLEISRRSEITMENPKSIYGFSHHDLSDTTILLVIQQENITQHPYWEKKKHFYSKMIMQR